MCLKVETQREDDGRWIAAIDPVGVLAYGNARAEAIRKATAVALEVIADRLTRGESPRTGKPARRSGPFSGVEFVARRVAVDEGTAGARHPCLPRSPGASAWRFKIPDCSTPGGDARVGLPCGPRKVPS